MRNWTEHWSERIHLRKNAIFFFFAGYGTQLVRKDSAAALEEQQSNHIGVRLQVRNSGSELKQLGG